MDAVTIPVMAKARIGHFAEAQVLQISRRDCDRRIRSLTPADEKYHIDKEKYTIPFVCGARDLGEALRRIAEGAAMIRSKGEAGSGNIVEAVRHMRAIRDGIAELSAVPKEELVVRARDIGAPLEIIREVADEGSCRSCCSARAALRRRPTLRSMMGSVPKASSSGAASSSRESRQVRESHRRRNNALQRSEDRDGCATANRRRQHDARTDVAALLPQSS